MRQLPAIQDALHIRSLEEERAWPESLESPKANTQPPDASARSIASSPIPNLSESRKRRPSELRLLHRYTTRTALSISLSLSAIWTTVLPRLAFEQDALLSAMCSISALHLAKLGHCDSNTLPMGSQGDVHGQERTAKSRSSAGKKVQSPALSNRCEFSREHHNFLNAHREYLDSAIRGHTNDVLNLHKGNADAACLTSSMIRVAAFAMLQDHSLEPYTPPTQWLQTTQGAGKVFKVAWEWIGNDEDSIAQRLTKGVPECKDPRVLYGENHRESLLHLLRRSQADMVTEHWSAEVEEEYASTLSVIGSV